MKIDVTEDTTMNEFIEKVGSFEQLFKMSADDIKSSGEMSNPSVHSFYIGMGRLLDTQLGGPRTPEELDYFITQCGMLAGAMDAVITLRTKVNARLN